MRWWRDGTLVDGVDAAELDLAHSRTAFGQHVELNVIGTALAIGLGAAAAAGGSIAGGALAQKGANAQAKAAESSSAAAIAEQRRQFDITQGNLQPWLTAGTQAIQTLQYLLGLGMPPGQAITTTAQATGMPPERIAQLQAMSRDMPFGRSFDMERDGEGVWEPSSITGTGAPTPGATTPSGYNSGDFGSLNRDFSAADFQADPGYDFRLKEGFKALERSAAARGTALSGGTLKELARYNQGFASNEFGNAYNRFQENRRTRFNQLAAISGVGQQTGTALGSFGADNARTIGDITIGGATSAAAARASGYNAWGQALGGIGNNVMNWYLLNQMNRNQNPGGTPPFVFKP